MLEQYFWRMGVMSEQIALKAERRTVVGKKVKRLRASGQLPAVVYGEKIAPVACSVDMKALEIVLHSHGRNAIIALVTGETTQSTIIKDIQHHPLRGNITHVDFHRIDLTRTIVVDVPIEAVGIPEGVRNSGGMLEHMLHSLEIECLPMEIPDRVTVDVSALGIGGSIHVSDIKLENLAHVIVTEGDRAVFSVAAPAVAREGEEAVAEAVITEPEVIERGKKDEEEI
jgi:large subunit ribosomal protein L25